MELRTMKIYMKSGNIITLDGIVDWEIKNIGDEITFLKFTWEKDMKGKEKLIMNSLCLTQIEAITEIKR